MADVDWCVGVGWITVGWITCIDGIMDGAFVDGIDEVITGTETEATFNCGRGGGGGATGGCTGFVSFTFFTNRCVIVTPLKAFSNRRMTDGENLHRTLHSNIHRAC